jgi:hypothetical protein
MNLLELAEKAGLAVGYQQHLATTEELQAFADLVLEEAAKCAEEQSGGLDDEGGGRDPTQMEIAYAIRALKGGM